MPLTQTEILRVTEVKDEEVSEKTYHHMVRGSTFYDTKGRGHSFDHNGELKTKSKNLQMELDEIADKPGSQVYSKGRTAVPAPGDDKPQQEITDRAAAAVAELRARQAAGKPQ